MVDELLAEVRAAKRAKAAYDRHMEKIRDLLPVVRATNVKKYGPATLEEMIGKLADERGTISRLTAEAVGTSKESAPAES